MSKQDEYRAFAAGCLELAKSSGISDDKTRLLVMAEAWLALAERNARSAEIQVRKVANHPLVSEAFGDSPVETE